MEMLHKSAELSALVRDLANRFDGEPMANVITALAFCTAGASAGLGMEVEEFLENFSENVVSFHAFIIKNAPDSIWENLQ